MPTEKKFAPACERNQPFILEVLSRIFTTPGNVLEVGSGTGQHAVYFAARLPHLQWQPTDLPDNQASIEAWRREAGLPNVGGARALDLTDTGAWQAETQYVVCINTVHIVAWPLVESLFELVGRVLAPGGVLYCYGPFRYSDRPLEPSNERFDRILRAQDPESGIRLFEDVDRLARSRGLQHAGDEEMPANNRSLWWRKL